MKSWVVAAGSEAHHAVYSAVSRTAAPVRWITWVRVRVRARVRIRVRVRIRMRVRVRVRVRV